MKNTIKILCMGVVATIFSSCVTGAFDENPQLDELNNAMAYSPKVVSITVNGQPVVRNTQSIYQVDAKFGDVLSISAQIDAGKGAELEELIFEQTLFSTEIEEFNSFLFPAGSQEDFDSQYTYGPVDAGDDGIYDAGDAIIPLSGVSSTFNYDFTVFELDPWGPFYQMHTGDYITLHLRVRNSLDNMGYHPISIHLVE